MIVVRAWGRDPNDPRKEIVMHEVRFDERVKMLLDVDQSPGDEPALPLAEAVKRTIRKFEERDRGWRVERKG